MLPLVAMLKLVRLRSRTHTSRIVSCLRQRFCVEIGPLCDEFTGHRWIPPTKASDVDLWCFLWSAPWINGWVNNREAGDLRRHRAHYGVIAMPVRYIIIVLPAMMCFPENLYTTHFTAVSYVKTPDNDNELFVVVPLINVPFTGPWYKNVVKHIHTTYTAATWRKHGYGIYMHVYVYACVCGVWCVCVCVCVCVCMCFVYIIP